MMEFQCMMMLAQTRKLPQGQIVLWSCVLIVMIIIAFVIATFVRRRINEEEPPDPGPAFTLFELRAMRDAGELAEEEYERARAQVIATSRGEISSMRDAKINEASEASDTQNSENESESGDTTDESDHEDDPPVKNG